MRNFIILFGSAAALASVPAAAQLGGTVGGAVGGTVNAATRPVSGEAQTRTDATVNTRVDTAPVLDSAGRVITKAGNAGGRVVDHTQHVAHKTVNTTSVAVVTHEQVTSGLVVRDERGQRIGTVARVEGNQALVVSGGRTYSVPLANLYRRTTGAAGVLVSSIPRAQLSAKVNARASTRSAVNSGN